MLPHPSNPVRFFSGGAPVSTEHSRRRLHVEVDRLASLKAAQKIKCLFRERIRHGCVTYAPDSLPDACYGTESQLSRQLHGGETAPCSYSTGFWLRKSRRRADPERHPHLRLNMEMLASTVSRTGVRLPSPPASVFSEKKLRLGKPLGEPSRTFLWGAAP